MGDIIVFLLPALAALATFGVFLKVMMPSRKAVSIDTRLSQFA